eukprot:6441619-Amphidinium_carterae.2
MGVAWQQSPGSRGQGSARVLSSQALLCAQSCHPQIRPNPSGLLTDTPHSTHVASFSETFSQHAAA